MKGKRHKKQNQQGAKDEVGNVPEIIPTATPSNSNPEDQTTHIKQYAQPRDPIVNWWLFLATIIIAIIYSLQLIAMRDSNEISRQALIAVQRAFVGFTGIQNQRRMMWTPELIIGSTHKMVNGKLVDLHTPEQVQREGHYPQWDILGTFENSGSTPANNVTIQVFADMKGSEPSQNAFAFDPNRSVDTLAPKAGTAVSCDRPYFDTQLFLSKVDEQDLTKTFVSPNFLVFGWAVYNDSFPKTETHVTEFCQRLHGVKQTPKGLELIFTNCQSHNCADRQCPDYEHVVRALQKAGKAN